MNQSSTDKHVLGRAEFITFPGIDVFNIPARIDTGAKTSALWATDVREESNGTLSFLLFDETSPYHFPNRHVVEHFDKIMVTSTIGESEERYRIQLLVELSGRKIRASFTLANRSRQVYPVLIGRNVLKGKFIVDVSIGEAHIKRNTIIKGDAA